MDPLLLKFAEIALAAALPFGIEKTLRWHLRRRRLKDVSHVFPVSAEDRSMTVKCSILRTVGGKSPETIRAYVHSAEALALKNVTSSLEPLGIKLDLGSFYGPPTNAKHLLLIGSGAHNPDSEAMMMNIGKYSCVFPKSGEHFYFMLNGLPYKCIHKQNTSEIHVATDYGLIARRRLGERLVLLLAGIHMHGTLAAAEVALSKQFQSEVRSKGFSSFSQLVKVDVEAKLGLDIQSITINWRDYPLSQLSDA